MGIPATDIKNFIAMLNKAHEEFYIIEDKDPQFKGYKNIQLKNANITFCFANDGKLYHVRPTEFKEEN